MANEQEVVLTAEGLAKLESELEYLKTVKRVEVAERIKQAREFGDISENSEYEDAKNEQGFIEGNISNIETILRTAKVEEKTVKGTVHVGSTVQLQEEDGSEVTYTIVGTTETDPLNFKISSESPVGKALLGQKKGTTVNVEVPVGTITYKIVSVK